MILDQLLTVLASLPVKSQKLVQAKMDFRAKPAQEVFRDIIETMRAVTKNAAGRAVIDVYANLPISDDDILACFGDRKSSLNSSHSTRSRMPSSA